MRALYATVPVLLWTQNAPRNQTSRSCTRLLRRNSFYFAPNLFLDNVVEHCEGPYQSLQPAAELSSINGTPFAVMMWRSGGTAVFQCSFDLRRFPFDEQLLEIVLQSDYAMEDVELVRNMKASYNSKILSGANWLGEYIMSPVLHIQVVYTRPHESSSRLVRCSLKAQLVIRRARLFWLLNVFTPMFIFVFISFSACAPPYENA